MFAPYLIGELVREPSLSVVRRWIGSSEAWVRQLVTTAPKHSEMVAVVAMGSAVRDRGHRRSDVDLLIVYSGPKPRLRPPVEVDIRYHAKQEVEELTARGHEVLGWAIKFGIPVYDPTNYWSSVSSIWATRVPLPSAEEAEVRAKKSLATAISMLDAGDEDAANDLLLAALTQFVRTDLIRSGVFPASRPELPVQLRKIRPGDELAQLLEDAMFADRSAEELLEGLAHLQRTTPA